MRPIASEDLYAEVPQRRLPSPGLVQAAERVGEVVSTHVIARPHGNIEMVLPLGRHDEVEAEQKGKKR